MYIRLLRHITIDSRALSLMRVTIGLVLVVDILCRFPYAEAFYGPNGIFPIGVFYSHTDAFGMLSLHLIGANTWQYVLLSVELLFAILLVLGVRTQLSTAVCLILLLSAHNRNPYILQGGDDLLRLVLFWGIFLPWGRHFAYRKPQEQVIQIQGLAVWAMVLQVLSVYFYSALLKGPEWHTQFTAVSFAYRLESIAYPTATYLLNFPELLKLFTAAAYFFELLIPVILVVFFPYPFIRILAFGCIILFHLWNASTLLIGIFPWVGIASACVLLPERFFGRIFSNQKSSENTIQPTTAISQALLLLGIVYVQVWNLNNIKIFPYKMSEEMTIAGRVLRLDQSWGMFAPGVLKDDGWFVLKADNRDLIHNREHYQITDKPATKDDLFSNDRWRKFGEHLSQPRTYFLQKPFCKYALMNIYQSDADSATLYFINELTTSNGNNQPLEIELCGCSTMAAHP